MDDLNLGLSRRPQIISRECVVIIADAGAVNQSQRRVDLAAPSGVFGVTSERRMELSPKFRTAE